MNVCRVDLFVFPWHADAYATKYYYVDEGHKVTRDECILLMADAIEGLGYDVVDLVFSANKITILPWTIRDGKLMA